MNNENQFEEPFDAGLRLSSAESPQGKEKKEVPRPPAAQAKVRTMQSDLKSLQESGGQAPQPYLIEIDHQPAVLKQGNKSLFIILGILVLIFIIVLGLIWLY